MKKSTALVVRPADADTILATERARLAIELAARQTELEADAAPDALATITVGDDEEYALVTGMRGEVRKIHDELVALRQAAAQPWKKVATTIEAMFRVGIQAAERIEADYRAKLEAYQVKKIQAERAAREAATKAAQADDGQALVAALTQSAALAAPIADGGRVSLRWTVKRVAADLLPAEYWCPDMAKIEAVAKAHKGEDPPVIPGVVFEQVASVAVKK